MAESATIIKNFEVLERVRTIEEGIVLALLRATTSKNIIIK
jgi:hypothetical protein